MIQPMHANGCSREYIAGWNAAHIELCERIEAVESRAELLRRCAKVIWKHEAHPCNMMPLGSIEELAEDLRREIFK